MSHHFLGFQLCETRAMKKTLPVKYILGVFSLAIAESWTFFFVDIKPCPGLRIRLTLYWIFSYKNTSNVSNCSGLPDSRKELKWANENSTDSAAFGPIKQNLLSSSHSCLNSSLLSNSLKQAHVAVKSCLSKLSGLGVEEGSVEPPTPLPPTLTLPPAPLPAPTLKAKSLLTG